MRCKNCGFENESETKFCTNCGQSLGKIEPVNTATNQPKKGSNTALIAIFIIFGILIFIAITIFVVYKVVFSEVKNNSGVKKYNQSSESVQSDNSNNTASSNTNNSSNTASSNSVSGKVDNENQVIGTDEFGYVTIPKNWNRFYDVESSGTYQYSYGNSWIVTLYAVPTTQIDSYNYANNVKAHLEEENVSDITGAKVKVGNYDAYQVYGHYDDENIWLVCWFFEAEDGSTHYIAVEGPDKTSDFFNIPNTFKLKR